MGIFGALDKVQGKTLYRIMSAACGSAFMLYGWDAGGYLPVIDALILTNLEHQVCSEASKELHNFTMPSATPQDHSSFQSLRPFITSLLVSCPSLSVLSV